MFARSFAAILLVLPALASALPQNDGFANNNIRPNAGNQPTAVDQCNTGALQCCNETQTVQTSETAQLFGLLGFVTGGPDTLIGLNCTPLTIVGSGDNSCTAQPVCCSGNDFNGLVVLGCNPLNLGDLASVIAVAELVGDLVDGA